jgi:hypothetical protein
MAESERVVFRDVKERGGGIYREKIVGGLMHSSSSSSRDYIRKGGKTRV